MCHRLEALLKVLKEKKLRSYPASRDEPAVSSALEWTPDNTAAALKGCAFDQHLGLKLYHEDPLPLIESACALAGCQFLDHEFLVHPSATVSIAGSLGLAPASSQILTRRTWAAGGIVRGWRGWKSSSIAQRNAGGGLGDIR